MNTAPLSPDAPAHYHLLLQGRINADWTDWLADAATTFEDDQTNISGTVRDQAALFGLISFVRDLGASLLLVEYLPDIKSQEGESDEDQFAQDNM